MYSNGRSFFFYKEIQNFKVVPKLSSVFYIKIQNLKVAPKRPSVIFQRNTNFWNCAKGRSFFYNEIQNFESFTQTVILISLKEIRNLTIYHQFSVVSQKGEKIKNMISRCLVSCFEIINIIELWITHYSQKGL